MTSEWAKALAIEYRKGILAARDALIMNGESGLRDMFEQAEKDLIAAGAMAPADQPTGEQ